MLPGHLSLRDQEVFDKVYMLARELDEIGLADLVARGASVSIRMHDSTPITRLAEQGCHDAVKLLLDKFDALLEDAVDGYVLGGDQKRANQLIAAGASLERAMTAYVKAQDVVNINKLLEQGVGGYYLVVHYAQQGDVAKVNELIAAGAPLNAAVYGYACAGREQLVNSIIDLNEPDDLRCAAIFGYARAGNVARLNQFQLTETELAGVVNEYISAGRDDLVRQMADANPALDRETIAYYYACDGRTEKVAEYTDVNTSREAIAEGYALGGHYSKVNDLLGGGVYHASVAYTYAFAGDIKGVNEQVKSMGNNIDLTEIIAGFDDNNYLGNCSGVLVFMLNFIDNESLRNAMVARIAENTGTPLADFSELLKHAKHLNQVIRTYGLNAVQAEGLLAQGAFKFLTMLKKPDSTHPLTELPVFRNIAGNLMGLSEEDTKVVTHAVHDRYGLFAKSRNSAKRKRDDVQSVPDNSKAQKK